MDRGWRIAAAVALAAAGLTAAGVAIGAFSEARGCERGQDCLPPAMTYFVIGMPAVALAALAAAGAVAVARGRRMTARRLAAVLAVAMVVAAAGGALVVTAPR